MFTDPDREAVAAYARRLGPEGLAEGTSGNISLRVGDEVLITPTAVAYERLKAADVCLVDLDGNRVAGDLAPSTELPMHLAVYRRTGALAVVHTHSPWATAVSTVTDELPTIHYLLTFLGGPVRVAPYATPGSAALGERLVVALRGRNGVLLQNHGAVAVGLTLGRAWWHAQILEWTAALWARAKQIGEPRILSPEELAQAADALRDYGMRES